MSTLVTEALETLQEVERFLASLPRTSPDHDAAALLAADLQDICDTLADSATPAVSNVAGARELVYGAQAHLRILRSRRERIGST